MEKNHPKPQCYHIINKPRMANNRILKLDQVHRAIVSYIFYNKKVIKYSIIEYCLILLYKGCFLTRVLVAKTLKFATNSVNFIRPYFALTFAFDLNLISLNFVKTAANKTVEAAF